MLVGDGKRNSRFLPWRDYGYSSDELDSIYDECSIRDVSN